MKELLLVYVAYVIAAGSPGPGAMAIMIVAMAQCRRSALLELEITETAFVRNRQAARRFTLQAAEKRLSPQRTLSPSLVTPAIERSAIVGT